MYGFSLGLKYFVSSLNGLHAVCAGSFASGLSMSFHLNEKPYSSICIPKCFWYHSFVFCGSLVLKNTPPSPVTRFIYLLVKKVLINIICYSDQRHSSALLPHLQIAA